MLSPQLTFQSFSFTTKPKIPKILSCRRIQPPPIYTPLCHPLHLLPPQVLSTPKDEWLCLFESHSVQNIEVERLRIWIEKDGRGNRKHDSVAISSNNVFTSLASLKKKKESKGSSKNGGSSRKVREEEKEQVFWPPAPLTVKSWADVDDKDDDDDYYATTAPPPAVWGDRENKIKGHETQVEEGIMPMEMKQKFLYQQYQDCFMQILLVKE